MLRTIRRRARHRVTICRELRHSDQINKSEHAGTDRPPARGQECPWPPWPRRRPPACPAWGEGRINPTPIRRQSVPCVRPDRTCCIFSTILRIVVHDFARQLFDQLLADHAILAAGFQVAGYDAGGPTLEASHLLTGPTGCPGFEVFRLAPDDPPPRTPPCHHLPRIKTFRSNK